jgi:hypothetical protein
MVTGVLLYQSGETVAAVQHRQQNSRQSKLGIETAADRFDGTHQAADSLQGIEFALQRDDDAC